MNKGICLKCLIYIFFNNKTGLFIVELSMKVYENTCKRYSLKES